VANGVVKVNLDSEAQYAFTRAAAGHMFSHYDGVLAVDGGVGDKRGASVSKRASRRSPSSSRATTAGS
jgi:fructose/tagatose bisphosphate aldolase